MHVAVNRGFWVQLDGKVDKLAFSDQAGLKAGEDLSLGFSLAANQAAVDWRFDIPHLTVSRETVYLDPIYVEVSETPLYSLPRDSGGKKPFIDMDHIPIQIPPLLEFHSFVMAIKINSSVTRRRFAEKTTQDRDREIA